MKRASILLISILIFSACAPSRSDTLPTLVPTIAFPTETPSPTNTPAPTPTFSRHSSAEGLVRTIAGLMIFNQDFQVERYYEYKGEPYPDDRIGYDINLWINSPDSYSRQEILQLAYSIMREFFYNFDDPNVMFVTLHLRGDENDPNCSLGLGIGYITARNFLPDKDPENLEDWYSFFVEEQYYGDLPGETDALLAYGNDPQNMPFCSIDEWK